jgi:hypothetical protein
MRKISLPFEQMFCVVILLVILSFMGVSVYSGEHGYQSRQLSSVAKPVAAAMDAAGISSLECSGFESIKIRFGGRFYPLLSPSGAMPCPVYEIFMISDDRSVRIVKMQKPVVPDTSDLEALFKTKTPDERRREFEAIAAAIPQAMVLAKALQIEDERHAKERAERQDQMRALWDAVR